MRPWRQQLPTLAFLSLLLLLGARVGWHASRSEVGWQMLAEQWTRTPPSLIGRARLELADQDPVDQSQFWLHECKRLQESETGPDTAIGAAWILDAPQRGFILRYVEAAKPPGGVFAGLQTLTTAFDAAARELARSEELCRPECLAAIDRATHVAPDDVDVWRNRALLQFWPKFNGLGFEPRRPDWHAVIDECSRRDPDNPLYDYLVALGDWTASATLRLDRSDYVIEVRDEDTFEEGNARIATASNKPRLAFPLRPGAMTFAFLGHSSISRMQRLAAAENIAVQERAEQLTFCILRWQSVRYRSRQRDSDSTGATAILNETAQIARQFEDAENMPHHSYSSLILKRFVVECLAELAVNDAQLIGRPELERLQSQRREYRLELEILSNAGGRLEARELPKCGLTNSAMVALTLCAQPLAEILIILGTVLWASKRLFGRKIREGRPHSCFPHLAAWFLGIFVSFSLLGLCPAEIISRDAQTLGFHGMLGVAGIVAGTGAVIDLGKRVGLSPSELFSLVATASLPWIAFCFGTVVLDSLIALVARAYPLVTIGLGGAAIALAWLVARGSLFFLKRADITARRKGWLALGFAVIAMFAVPWAGTAAQELRAFGESQKWILSSVEWQAHARGFSRDQALNALRAHSLAWALLEWKAHQGPLIGSVVAVVLLMIWRMSRPAPRTNGDERPLPRIGNRELLKLAAVEGARSLGYGGAIAFLVYLAAVPAAIDEREAYYQRHFTLLVDPASARRELDAEIAAIRADASLMDELRQKAEK
jgi:hypothetical protein